MSQDAGSTIGILAPLRHLPLARKGQLAYYSELAKSDDEVVRFGGYLQLLSHRVALPEQWAEILALSRFGVIKQKAFEYFEGAYEHDLAEQIADIAAQSPDVAQTALMRAELSFDHEAAGAAAVALFQATGEMRQLFRAATASEYLAGWTQSSKWLVRAAAIFPLEIEPMVRLFTGLINANQYDAVEHLCGLLGRAQMHPYLSGVYGAAIPLSLGDPKGALSRLAALKAPLPAAGRMAQEVEGYSLSVAGNAYEKLGDYRKAYVCFVEMNRHDTAPNVDNKQIVARARQLSQVSIPPLPASPRDDVVMMLGFPRSGTTLLENVLGMHPRIETLEEPPTWDAAGQWLISETRKGNRSGIGDATFFSAMRARYYDELQRRRLRPQAEFVVDKFPLRTISAVPLRKLFADQKYIFSIRHPFDVALSCFKQRFAPNQAMENFHSIKDTVELYDFTMSQWFGVHTLDDERVDYIKYDDLVTDFRPTLEKTLQFIGVEWDDRVEEFAKGSESRMARTPSYQKVRQGLSIGVQTYWRNYRFLFETPEAKPLYKWATFFGYETE